MNKLDVIDLAGVVYSSGKVFDGLQTGRLDTESFLIDGDLSGVTSRADLQLLEDLRDVAQFIIDHQDDSIDAEYVCTVNSKMTRSGALYPGQLRTAEQEIGVETPYGRHTPKPMTITSLQALIDEAFTSSEDPRELAIGLFVQLAKAQPFMDGNKRTALFVANSVLIREPGAELLAIPVDEDYPRSSTIFNDLLAQAYVFNEHDGVVDMLRSGGLESVRRMRFERRQRWNALLVKNLLRPSLASQLAIQLQRDLWEPPQAERTVDE